ncbi:hypothetical protein ACFFRR_006945 [Megaselia abdita]
MWTLLLAVSFCLCGVVSGANENITVHQYGYCQKEIRTFNKDSIKECLRPHGYMYVPYLLFNVADRPKEILRTKLYFRGKQFRVTLSQSVENTTFYHTVFGFGEYESAIYTSDKHGMFAEGTALCSYNKGITKLFDNEIYEELLLVITNDGEMKWFIAKIKEPFLTCSDPELIDTRFISFSGCKEGFVLYADCQVFAKDFFYKVGKEEEEEIVIEK